MSVVAPAETRMSRRLLAAVGGAAVMIGTTFGLWAYYGTTIFFEVVRAGWAACF